jgi:hypothetical protein
MGSPATAISGFIKKNQGSQVGITNALSCSRVISESLTRLLRYRFQRMGGF